MKKSEIAVIFNNICGIKFPFFENNFKLSSDRKQIDERREIIAKAKAHFKEWQKQYEDYLIGGGTVKTNKIDKASQLINAYNKARIEDDKAVIINIYNLFITSKFYRFITFTKCVTIIRKPCYRILRTITEINVANIT